MQLYHVLRLISVGAGMLFLAAGTSACAVSAQGGCADDDTECQLAEEGSNESVDSAEQNWRRGGLRPELAGLRFRTGDQGRAFIMDRRGYRRLIPNSRTYGNLFIDGREGWDNLRYYDDLRRVPLRGAFGVDAYLASGCGGDVGFEQDLDDPRDDLDPCGGRDDFDPYDGRGDFDPCGGRGDFDQSGGQGDLDPCGGRGDFDPRDSCVGTYLIDDGYRHGFRSPDVFDRYGFGRSNVRNMDWDDIRQLPKGDEWY